MNHVLLLGCDDTAILLKISAILLKYPTFEGGLFIFSKPK